MEFHLRHRMDLPLHPVPATIRNVISQWLRAHNVEVPVRGSEGSGQSAPSLPAGITEGAPQPRSTMVLPIAALSPETSIAVTLAASSPQPALPAPNPPASIASPKTSIADTPAASPHSASAVPKPPAAAAHSDGGGLRLALGHVGTRSDHASAEPRAGDGDAPPPRPTVETIILSDRVSADRADGIAPKPEASEPEKAVETGEGVVKAVAQYVLANSGFNLSLDARGRVLQELA
jgi:hypothetical protein